MSLLSVSELRQHFQTDLVDDAIQRLIDDAEREIDERHGELGTQTDTYRGEILATVIFLSRKAASISTVVEELRSGSDYEVTTLSSDDYQLRSDGRQIERLATGTNKRSTWGDVVTVTYQPADETIRRRRVTIDLVKLAAAYNALDSETTGDYAKRSLRYTDERASLISQLETWPWA